MSLPDLEEKERRFSVRPSLKPDEFYETFYKDSDLPEKTVIELLKMISSYTTIPVTKLRPSDRFDHELQWLPDWEYDDGPSLLLWDLSEFIEEKRADIDIKRVKTIDDYILAWITLQNI